MEIPVVEKEVQSHQPHYKVSEHPLSHSLNAFFPFLCAHPVFIIQMTLAPNYRLSPEDGKVLKTRKNRSAETAVTRYRILASSSACSLLELQPITGEVWPCLCIVTATQLLCALCLTVLSVQSGAVLEVGTSCRAWPRLWEVSLLPVVSAQGYLVQECWWMDGRCGADAHCGRCDVSPLLPLHLRSEAPDPGSSGLWAGVSNTGGSQILTLEQAGTPGKAGTVPQSVAKTSCLVAPAGVLKSGC